MYDVMCEQLCIMPERNMNDVCLKRFGLETRQCELQDSVSSYTTLAHKKYERLAKRNSGLWG